MSDYYETLKEHEARGCLCLSFDTEAGRKLRAGQFWDDKQNVDTRFKDPIGSMPMET